jgi:Protein of unknown function (DUF3429)
MPSLPIAMSEERIPPVALMLGLGGLIPFAVCAAAIWTDASWFLIDDPARAMLAYGALILSFLGGARWGFALRMTDTGLQARAFVLSVAPAIAAWFLLLGPTLMGLAVLPVMLLLLGLADEQLPKVGAPLWYRSLRRLLTAGAVLCCLAAVAGAVQ